MSVRGICYTDHLGTPQVMTDAAQAIVWNAKVEPFGKVLIKNQTVVNNIRLLGQYFDVETGLHYNYFRDCYDPLTGRYCEADPIGLRGGLNPYAYVGGNPVNKVDPLGLMDGCPTGMAPDGNHICRATSLEDPNAKVCVTAECAAGFLPAKDPEPLSPEAKCELKCSLGVGTACKAAAKTPGPWWAKGGAYLACEAAIELACHEGCKKKEPSCSTSGK